MTRKVSTRKSAEERRAEAEQLHETITEQIEALRDSETWTRFLAFAQAFHRYSLGNLLLSFAQCPEATQVAGYRTWQSLNRQVRKGEHGIRIFGGRDVRETVENEQTGEEEEQRRVRFFPVSVFDMGQTDLIDEKAGDPANIAQPLTGDDTAGIYNAVADYLTGKGWSVEREPIAGAANGYTATDGTQRVVIDANLYPAQAAKTALHEAAHVILHAGEDHAEYVEHRGIKETEAESVAHIVAGILGLDTSAYSVGYVAGWSNCDTDTVKATAANVLRAAHALADGITTTDSPAPVAA
ncbi:ArdC-like ssDNA-binding domain-containing protein [Microbacterium enclense]|uniref:ArdC-like ssDNA-binding domain-containing protein n=1 Tax=Microbacterium enclense TaxID=993073 RepID=UPI0021A5521A|nr:ArdC-like ssDNA-binding domain-containing protein [Microbacterium enclense]MCT2085602.1 ArdC-like ssDNA-binding domain-containing protein [Microbacterium enclense]